MSIRILSATLILLACACSAETTPPSAASSVLPQALALKVAPAPAWSVTEARAKAADGSEVILTGRAKDFADASTVFTLADMSLKSCADTEDEMQCTTPWDYCCEDRKLLAEGVVTIELLNGDKPGAGSAKGWNNLDHLREVTVRGTFKKDEQGNITVLANGLFVKAN
jgi:hypothetical protein